MYRSRSTALAALLAVGAALLATPPAGAAQSSKSGGSKAVVSTTLAIRPGRKLVAAYPANCTERPKDAQYPQGDIVASSVAPQGTGMKFSWTTRKAVPALQPGEVMQYWAKFDLGNGEPIALSLFFAEGAPLVASIDSYAVTRSMDVTSDVRIKQTGATMTAWLPATRFWTFVGRDRSPYLEDGAPLTAGSWDMITKWSTSTPGLAFGSEDHCGVDDSDRLQKT